VGLKKKKTQTSRGKRVSGERKGKGGILKRATSNKIRKKKGSKTQQGEGSGASQKGETEVRGT